MKMTKRFCWMLVICLTIGAIVCGGSSTAYAASEMDTAVAYLVEYGIYTGDNNGNLNLDKSLTRAELAVIVTRLECLDSPEEWETWGKVRFSDRANCYNKFTDVPDWAFPYVECSYQAGLINGVSETQFSPQGTVNPQMACTVLLRYCRITPVGQTPDWSYETAITKAQSIGIAPSEGLSGSEITRSTMAVIIYRSIQFTQGNSLAIVETVQPTITAPAVSEPTIESATTMTIDEMRMEIVRLTNEARVAEGLPELEVLPALMETAQAKAQDMVDNSYLNHISPTYGTPGNMIWAAIPQASEIGENAKSLLSWDGTVKEAFDTWLHSKEHRANILDPIFTHIGIGIAFDENGNGKWVQHFAQMP